VTAIKIPMRVMISSLDQDRFPGFRLPGLTVSGGGGAGAACEARTVVQSTRVTRP
jgi:hypothetical protein